MWLSFVYFAFTDMNRNKTSFYSLADPASSPFQTCYNDKLRRSLIRITSGETGGYELAFLATPKGLNILIVIMALLMQMLLMLLFSLFVIGLDLFCGAGLKNLRERG